MIALPKGSSVSRDTTTVATFSGGDSSGNDLNPWEAIEKFVAFIIKMKDFLNSSNSAKYIVRRIEAKQALKAITKFSEPWLGRKTKYTSMEE